MPETGPDLSHDQSPAAATATEWQAWLDRVRRAAASIAQDEDPRDAAGGTLALPPWLPECDPVLLGETIAAALLDRIGRRVADDMDWRRWRNYLLGLIGDVFDQPESARIRAVALAVVKDAIGVRYRDGDLSGEETLAEAFIDLRSIDVRGLVRSEPAAVQMQLNGRPVGLAFLPNVGQATPATALKSLLEQARDISVRRATRACAREWRFWSAAAGALWGGPKRRFWREPMAALEQKARRAAFAGIQGCIRYHLRAAGAATDGPPAIDNDTELPILMYHRVSDEGDTALSRYRVTPARFRQQMEWLDRNRYEAISLELLRAVCEGRRRLPPRPVLITFDDGYVDFYQNAWPILRAFDYPSVMFVVAGKVGQCSDWDAHLGRSEPLMDWQQLREISDHGVSIGSHSVTHRRFSRLTFQSAYDEMSRSSSLIEASLGRSPSAFCYPYGIYDRSIEPLLPVSRYEFGFTCDCAFATPTERPLRLARIEVFGSDDIPDFAAKMDRGSYLQTAQAADGHIVASGFE